MWTQHWAGFVCLLAGLAMRGVKDAEPTMTGFMETLAADRETITGDHDIRELIARRLGRPPTDADWIFSPVHAGAWARHQAAMISPYLNTDATQALVACVSKFETEELHARLMPALGKTLESFVLEQVLDGLAAEFRLLALAQAESAASAGQPPTNTQALAPTSTEKPSTRPKRKASINARMMETIQSNFEAAGWSCRRWAEELRCAKSSVAETRTWKDLTMQRDRLRAERRKDRRRRPKGSDQRKRKGQEAD
jgi:hypothetical protein